MIPNDTALATFAREFGDSAMVVMMNTFYDSSVVKLIIYISAVSMFIVLGVSLHRGKLSKLILVFWVAWISIIPINKKPLLFITINTFTELISSVLHKVSYNLLTSFGTKNAIPPGFVYNAIHRAAFSEVTDPVLKNNIRFLIENCVPNSVNKDGRPIGVNDLFGVKVNSTNPSGINPTESLEYNFDPNLLKVRTFDQGGNQVNCLDYLNSTLFGIRSHLKSKELLRQENNPGETTSLNSENSPEYQKLNQVALNLAQASAINKQIVKDYFPEANTSILKTVDASVAASASNASYLTGVTLSVMNTPKAIARSLNIDGVIDNASKLNDINEKILNLPYYTSYLQTILKIIAPLAILTMFLGTFRWIKYWSVAWTMSLTLPWFLYISRIISNSILMWALKLEENSPTHAYSSNYLLQGVNFQATSQILEDTSRMMSVFLQCELALWSSLFVIVPFSTWMVGQAGSNWVGRMGSATSGTVGGTATRVGTERAISSGMSKLGSKLGSFMGPAGTVAGASAGNAVADNLNQKSNETDKGTPNAEDSNSSLLN